MKKQVEKKLENSFTTRWLFLGKSTEVIVIMI